MTSAKYALIIVPTATRQLAEELADAVACAAHEFIIGPLLNDPHRVGTPLREPLTHRHSARRGTYRVIYHVDEQRRQVTVVGVFGRTYAPRTRPSTRTG